MEEVTIYFQGRTTSFSVGTTMFNNEWMNEWINQSINQWINTLHLSVIGGIRHLALWTL